MGLLARYYIYILISFVLTRKSVNTKANRVEKRKETESM